MKYYLTDNATMPRGGVMFETVSTQGLVIGVYKTDDKEKIAELNALAKSKRPPIKEITKEEYDERIHAYKTGPRTQITNPSPAHVNPMRTIHTAEPAPRQPVSIPGEPSLPVIDVTEVTRVRPVTAKEK